MDWIGVIVAGLAGFGFGAAWYVALGERWRLAAGLSEAQVKEGGARPTPYVVAAICTIVVAGMMRHVFAAGGLTDIVECTVSGFGVGAFLASPWLAMSYGFAQRPIMLTMIDAGHVAGACTVMGFVLALFL